MLDKQEMGLRGRQKNYGRFVRPPVWLEADDEPNNTEAMTEGRRLGDQMTYALT